MKTTGFAEYANSQQADSNSQTEHKSMNTKDL